MRTLKTLVSFAGKLGSGKNHHMMKQVDHLKDTGHTIYLISFADPIKKILKESFGFTKAGKDGRAFPEFTQLYVKYQVIDSLYNLIRPLKYEKFDISEGDLKAYIGKNYEIYEKEFYNYIWGTITGHDPINHCATNYNYCFRRLGQMLGTELGRHVVDSIWVDIAIDKVKKIFKADLADYAFIPDCRFINEYNMILDFKVKTAYDSIIYGVTASDETRASRRGLTIEELHSQDEHGSEKEVQDIIDMLPEENVILND